MFVLGMSLTVSIKHTFREAPLPHPVLGPGICKFDSDKKVTKRVFLCIISIQSSQAEKC